MQDWPRARGAPEDQHFARPFRRHDGIGRDDGFDLLEIISGEGRQRSMADRTPRRSGDTPRLACGDFIEGAIPGPVQTLLSKGSTLCYAWPGD
jgi:hypothetical protein